MTKKPNYGLPEIGNVNVAASLVRKLGDRGDRAEPAPSEEEEDAGAAAPEANLAPTQSTEPTGSTKFDRGEAAQFSSPTPLFQKRVGRPKGPPSRRMHLAIEESLANYLNRAWRTHERADGSLASGPADLVEDLLEEHRRRVQRS